MSELIYIYVCYSSSHWKSFEIFTIVCFLFIFSKPYSSHLIIDLLTALCSLYVCVYRKTFEDLFSSKVRQLLHNFPLDRLTASGTPFW